MDHYLDIELRPDPEVAPHQVMAALYAKLHRALAALGSTDIGVSFPDFGAKAGGLGARLRLHGARPALLRLTQKEWLAGVRDHVNVGDLLEVPACAQHRAVRRVQAKSSPARLRRRLIRRHGLGEDEAASRIPDNVAKCLDLPFIQIASASTGQTFRLFIAHEPIRQSAVVGTFNAYGLSPEATLPWF